VARAALYTGFIGGIGFAAASMLKLVEVKSGYETNWHSILEQTTGLLNGIAVAAAVAVLARRTPVLADDQEPRPWTEPWALAFVVLGITYLNWRKNVSTWIEARSMTANLAGLPAWAWFDLAYVALALTLLALWLRHRRSPRPGVIARPCRGAAAASAKSAGGDRRRGPVRGRPVDIRRLGHCAGRPRRPARQPRRAEHPVRPASHEHTARETLTSQHPPCSAPRPTPCLTPGFRPVHDVRVWVRGGRRARMISPQ
jgi:hypothetical protein